MEQHSQEKSGQIHSRETQQSESQNDDDEALSLRDLVTNEHDDPEQNLSEQEDDFAFGGSGSNSPENKMCTADELFFRGQILPLRHSVTLPSRLTTRTEEFTPSISVSRSEPTSAASSADSNRSSRTRSSTSVSESNGFGYGYVYGPDIRNRNQFHSHPSLTPRIRTRSLRYYSDKSPSKWRLLQLGPMKVEEIGLADLRNRSHGKGNKKKEILMSFAGCKCSADVVESTVVSRISMVKPTTLNEEETGFCGSKESNVGRGKHVVSSHRTSEWLKQLFVQKM